MNCDEFFGGMECLTSNKPFDFGTEPDHDPDPGIFKGIFTTAGQSQLEEFCGSAASATVCDLWVLRVIIVIIITAFDMPIENDSTQTPAQLKLSCTVTTKRRN